MPRRKRPIAEVEEEEDEYEESPSQLSQASSSSSQKGKSKSVVLGEEEISKLIGDVIRFMLMQNFQKIPVKHSSLVKEVLSSCGKDYVQIIVDGAKKTFSEVFGYEMREVHRAANAAKIYVLVNELEAKVPIIDIGYKAPPFGLLLVVLSVIELSEGKIYSNTLQNYLQHLNLNRNQVDHPVFGDWKKTLDLFVRQMYLEKKKVPEQSKDGVIVYEYTPGVRALAEIDKKTILTFVAKAYGEDSVDPVHAKGLNGTGDGEEEESEEEESGEEESGEEESEEEESEEEESEEDVAPTQITKRTPRKGR